MIEVSHLNKFYGSFQALDDVSFRVEKGEILGFLGPNGAGKTTAMRILTGFMPPTSGSVNILGMDIMKESLKAREKIGYLPESVPLYKDLTVNEYLNFVSQVKNGAGGPEEAMEQCGLVPAKDKIIGKLSRGYRQRVGLAQALIGDPEVLVLDEPTIGLDPKQIVEIRRLIKALGQERTVILSSHILPEVSMICERVMIINEGRMIAEDTPENLQRRMQRTNRLFLLIEGKEQDIHELFERFDEITRYGIELEKEDGDQSHYRVIVEAHKDRDIRKELSKAVVMKNLGLLEIQMDKMSLEDVFVELVTSEEEVAE